MMVSWVAIVLVAILLYIYGAYKYALKVIQVFCIRSRCSDDVGSFKKVTVLLTVRNEQADICERLANILNQSYPPELLEVLVASDGSTDSTNRFVSEIDDSRVLLFASELGLGKTATQNAAIKLATGEIVIFTDAGSRFELDFIHKLVTSFADKSVGAADGHLLFSAKSANQIAKSQGYYWRYELALREAESRLGILAVASGACLAVRRDLLREMDPSIGEDCIVPLDVIEQGFKVVHVPDAIAYDVMENDPEREFSSRVRMTLRNWQGTWSRPQLLNPFVHPGYAFALWSHKLLRWLSPFFLIALALCLTAGTMLGSIAMQIGLGLMAVFCCLALLGWGAEKWQWRVPGGATIYSFMLANAGFLVGVSKATLGRKIFKYR